MQPDGKGGGDIEKRFTYLSAEELTSTVELCNDCCNGNCHSYHCPLCPSEVFKPTVKKKVQSHLEKTHWKTGVRGSNEYYSVVCKLYHTGINGRHFHCPTCQKIIVRKENLKEHVRKCPKLPPTLHTKNPINNCTESDHVYAGSYDTENNSKAQTKHGLRMDCEQCGKQISRRWMKHHLNLHKKGIPEITESRHHYTVTIDAKEGLFCSTINPKGPSVPIHVKKKTTGTEKDIFCENFNCIELKETAKRGNNYSFECDHVKSTQYAINGMLIQMDLQILQYLQDISFLSPDRCKEILKLQETAKKTNAPFVVMIPNSVFSSDRCIYLSVFSGTQRYWSLLQRTIVTIDTEKSEVLCRCSKSKRYCVHKAVGKWFIKQKFPALFQTIDQEYEDTCTEFLTDDIDINEVDHQPCQQQLMPPSFCNLIKKIPPKIERKIPNIVKIKDNGVYPVEDVCSQCSSRLESKLASRNAKLILMNNVVKDILVYEKICRSCNMRFRYQEWEDGFHNFNNRLLLGHDVCVFLRSGLQNHVAIGRSLAVLEDTLGERINILETYQGYLHFEAMTDHSYIFSCVLCGYHPSILIWDTFRKATFKFAVSDLKVPVEEEATDFVNITDFWSRIEENIIETGILQDKSRSRNIEPNYTCWAPWIGPYSRKGDVVYNTEYKKCTTSSDEEINEAISEELLLHLLLDEKLVNIRKLCRELGLSDKGSSMDMIVRMREKSVTKTGFDHAYEKVFGCSGGWAVGCCRHGVVYCIKNLLRSESPRDYVDLERSLKHRPTLTICDMAHLLAQHGNNTVPNFYNPNKGRLCPVNEENIRKAQNDELMLSAPFLVDQLPYFNANDQNSNPITGSREHYAIFDWFHQLNCKKEEEILRKCSLLKELSGLVDTQAVEQLFSSNKKDLYFLNTMLPCTHLFVFRLITHLKNEKKNQHVILRQKKKLKEISFNQIGQICQKELDTISQLDTIHQKFEAEVIYEAVPLSPVGKCRQTLNTRTKENTFETPNDLFNLSRNAKEQIEEFQFLCDIAEVATKDWINLTPDEQENVKKNCRYANTTIFQQAAPFRQNEVVVLQTSYGIHQYQGVSNYCGLCCLNNVFQDYKDYLLISIKEMDQVADSLWLQMVENPGIGLTSEIEPMRDREGFYSVEVLQAVAQKKGFQMVGIDPRTLTNMPTIEIGQNIFSETERTGLIIRKREQQHWTALRKICNVVLLHDSKEMSPTILTDHEIGTYIHNNMQPPGSVYIIFKADTTNSRGTPTTFDDADFMDIQQSVTDAKSIINNVQDFVDTSLPSEMTEGSYTDSYQYDQNSAEKDSRTKYKLRGLIPKKRSLSFVFPDVRAVRTLHCICRTKDDGRKYWKCESCEGWFHPACLGYTDDKDPEDFMCSDCLIRTRPRNSRCTRRKKVEESGCNSNDEHVLPKCDDEKVYDEDHRVSSVRHIPFQYCMSKVPEMIKRMKNVMLCLNENCLQCSEQKIQLDKTENNNNDHVDHVRHHEFIRNPEFVYNRERKTYCFGTDCISQQTNEELILKLTNDMIYTYIDQRHPYTSSRKRKIRDLSDCPVQRIFDRHGLMADHYIGFVCFKEILIWIICDYTGCPYEYAETMCIKTEISMKKILTDLKQSDKN